jgi:hypothetical protein
MHPSETAIRTSIGVSRIMWGSDYPHTEATYPYSEAAIRLAYAGVPEDEVELMLAGNAARVFGFDLEALARHAERVGPERDGVTAGVDPASLPAGVAKSPAFAGITPGSSRTRWVDNRKA